MFFFKIMPIFAHYLTSKEINATKLKPNGNETSF